MPCVGSMDYFFREGDFKLIIRKTSLPGTKKLSWRIIIAVILGLAVAVTAFYFNQQYMHTHQETEQVVVPTRDISPYTIITTEDIGWRTILAGAREPGTVTASQEIVGRMVKSMIYKDEQIRKERLVDPSDLDRQEVTVNIDPARIGSAKTGDTVDVYLAQSENAPGALLATDCIIKSVKDTAGVSISGSSSNATSIVQAVKKKTDDVAEVAPAPQPQVPAMTTLSVKPEEVAQVTRGAAGKGIVLVKKYKPSNLPMEEDSITPLYGEWNLSEDPAEQLEQEQPVQSNAQ